MAGGFLSGVEALLLNQGLGKIRVGILSKQLVKFGGVAVKTLSESTTHILVGNKTRLARVPVLLKIPSIPETVPVLRADWLSSCLAKRERLSEEAYRVQSEYSPRKSTSSPLSPVKNSASNTASTTPKATAITLGQAKAPNVSTYTQGIKEEEGEGTSYIQDQSDIEPKEDVTEKPPVGEETDGSPPKKKKGRWICEMSSTTAQTWVNHNKHISDKLEELLVVYKNDGEKWRVMSTTKAIQAIKDHLAINSGETRLAYHRATRHYNGQKKTLGYLLGPVSSAEYSTSERLDRPVVKMYQRHMEKDLPDAHHLMKATQQCTDAMDTTMKNMALLKLASKGLETDLSCKTKVASLDSSVVRLRRRKANHRWVLEGSAHAIVKPNSKHAVRSLSH